MYHYTINLARNGKHLFRVELGKDGASDGNEANVVRIARELNERFGDCEISVTRRNITSTNVTDNVLN